MGSCAHRNDHSSFNFRSVGCYIPATPPHGPAPWRHTVAAPPTEESAPCPEPVSPHWDTTNPTAS
ncbi:hypothetical protein TPA0909_68510 [Streptomyces albus]|nr:hypothetical protein TPA0909_68510 [Streptomyces albus]